jgi:uncharacterized protein (DUF1778 family)
MAQAATRRQKRIQRSESPRKDQRLEARIDAPQKALIERAAYLKGMNVTQFVTLSSHEAALKTIQEHETLTLRDAARDVFINAILNPPVPNDAARAAAARYKALIRRR